MSKTMTIQGVPFSVSGESVYMHGTSVQIGTYNGTLALKEDWENHAKAYLAEYRNKLEVATTAALAKAAELQLQK
jgi:hypothetical protein